MSPFRFIPAHICRFVTLVLVLGNASVALARRWEDVIAVSIYAQSHVDIARLQFSLEDDPLSRQSPTSPLPMDLEETYPPSDAPSSVPSAYIVNEFEKDFDQQVQQQQQQQYMYQQVQQDDEEEEDSSNRGEECLERELAYTVKKTDDQGEATYISITQIGDGDEEEEEAYTEDIQDESLANYRYGGQTPEIIEELSLEKYSTYVLRSSMQGADFGAEQVCLSYTKCYEIRLQGGSWDAAFWDILPFSTEEGTGGADAIAKGRGFSNCTFHLAEPDEPSPCPFTCEPRPETKLESYETNMVGEPVEILPGAPSNVPSDAPSMVPTRM